MKSSLFVKTKFILIRIPIAFVSRAKNEYFTLQIAVLAHGCSRQASLHLSTAHLSLPSQSPFFRQLLFAEVAAIKQRTTIEIKNRRYILTGNDRESRTTCLDCRCFGNTKIKIRNFHILTVNQRERR